MDDRTAILLNRQQQIWNNCFSDRKDMFGAEASLPARRTLEQPGLAPGQRVLELGSGQGRDTLFFLQQGCAVTAVDYSPAALADLKAKLDQAGRQADLLELDLRRPLPFADGSFDLCYSHMLFCMALTTDELTALCREIRRVLRPGGHCVYTARNQRDPHFGKGRHLGDGLYQKGAVVIHYFSPQMVQLLADQGFSLVECEEFEEDILPRILYRVTMRRD